jgi:hypothetical protein
MNEFWQRDLTEEETEALIAKAAAEVTKRKLFVPAIAFLEMHKPLANVMGHAGIAFAPFLVPFFGFDAINDYSRLITKRDNIERLIQRIEQAAASPPKETSTTCNGKTPVGS